MSIHTKVLRVTPEADARTRAYAEEKGMGVYDAATLLILRADGATAEQGAESKPSFATAPVYPLRVHVYAESLGIPPTEALNRLVEMAFASPPAPDPILPTIEKAPTPKRDPLVAYYAKSRSLTYEEALAKCADLGARRQKALDTAAGKAWPT